MIVVAWLIASAPEANPLTLGLIVVGLFFWLGKAFHHVWDVAHTRALGADLRRKRAQDHRMGALPVVAALEKRPCAHLGLVRP